MIWTTSWELLKRNRAQLLRGAEGIQCEQLSAQVRVASNKHAPNTEEFQLFTNKGLFFLKSDLFKTYMRVFVTATLFTFLYSRMNSSIIKRIIKERHCRSVIIIVIIALICTVVQAGVTDIAPLFLKNKIFNNLVSCILNC